MKTFQITLLSMFLIGFLYGLNQEHPAEHSIEAIKNVKDNLLPNTFLSSAAARSSADVPEDLTEPGIGTGLGFGMGIQGILSYFEAGVLRTGVGGNKFIGVRAKYMSSLTWATYADEDGQVVSCHPVVVGGVFTFGGTSPLLHGLFRARGGTDVLLGYSFTPYDNLIYKTGNLIGNNVTFGVTGFFGLELFTGEHTSIYFDAGGGFKMHTGDEENPYVIASSWLGSGFMLRVGMTFYR